MSAELKTSYFRFTAVTRLIPVALTSLLLALSACGGGTTAGVGGSGIGGTGITTASVNGNVVQVTAGLLEQPGNESARLLAELLDLLSSPADAQVFGIANITVKGGGRSSVTDQFGRFNLPDVAPSNNFILTMTLPGGQQVTLTVGNVPAGTIVEVRNIVINTGQKQATSDEIEVKEDPSKQEDQTSEDDVSSDNSGPGSGSEDEKSEDDVSTDNSGSGSESSGTG